MTSDTLFANNIFESDARKIRKTQQTLEQMKYVANVTHDCACIPRASRARGNKRRASNIRHFTIRFQGVCLFVSLFLLLIGHGLAQPQVDTITKLVTLQRRLFLTS